ncbi:hypothetical protein HMPREF3213_01242 [Heyndrickxia coagulans]|uniref:Uncharacterized protein n=1 Tax=Heyndrickxia coagulans TaxID=1398 RepID=A0A133KVA1_HEYCO|nr:hypothetical protein HMPREF3213_01242 [Heyndrickxia coagulans]
MLNFFRPCLSHKNRREKGFWRFFSFRAGSYLIFYHIISIINDSISFCLQQ